MPDFIDPLENYYKKNPDQVKPSQNAPVTPTNEADFVDPALQDTTIKRTTGQKLAGAFAKYARPALEYGGAVGGGIIGAAATGIPGLVTGPGAVATGAMGGATGAGLGYAGGRQLANALEEYAGLKQPSTLRQAAGQAVMDVPVGMASEMGGQLIGKGIQAAQPFLKKTAKDVYQSALKPLVTTSQKEVDKRIATALEEALPVTKGGLEKSKGRVGALNREIGERLKAYEAATIKTARATEPLIDLYLGVEKKNLTPQAEMSIIRNYYNKVRTGQPIDMPVQQAQIFKQTLNKELDDYYSNLARGRIPPQNALVRTKAAMADGLRTEIANIVPELKMLNRREGTLIQLNKSLERAVKRIDNRELIPLAVGVATGSGGNLLRTIALKAADQPYIKSQLAFALNRANGKMMQRFGQTGLLAAMAQTPEGAAEQGGGLLGQLNPIGTAEAGENPLREYSRGITRQQQLSEAMREPAPSRSQPAPASRNTEATPDDPEAVRAYREKLRLREEQERLAKKPEKKKQRRIKQVVRKVAGGGEELLYVDLDSGEAFENDPNEE